ncbi:helix-turn-helix domain-containing protein [Streptomyces sp. CA-111067]|uniref:helix-turn-helix domain-containing protein n=1 Tax=Streptomyces sp. CA-111067 TaxID=3240046 RepID=UPI003D963A29
MPDIRLLGAALRERRERVSPAAVGLNGVGRRRAQGLRREELAELAGVSEDYLKRLEQGRRHPSLSVLNALTRALDTSREEYEYLCLLAGYAAADGQVPRTISPAARRLMERLDGTAVCICDATWSVIGWNRGWEVLVCGPTAANQRTSNLAWRVFVADDGRVSRSPRDEEAFQRFLVTELRTASLRYPADKELAALVAALREASQRFDTMWSSPTTSADPLATSMVLDHPVIGPVRLDCDMMDVRDNDLRAVVFTAVPESPEASRLRTIVSSPSRTETQGAY